MQQEQHSCSSSTFSVFHHKDGVFHCQEKATFDEASNTFLELGHLAKAIVHSRNLLGLFVDDGFRQQFLQLLKPHYDEFKPVHDKLFGVVAWGARVRASSEWDANHKSDYCRLDLVQPRENVSASSWCAGSNDTHQWIEFATQSPKKFVSITTQGRHGGCAQWVTKYKVEYSNDGAHWVAVDGGRVFQGNTDEDTHVSHRFYAAFLARLVRIVPLEWHSHISMRCEVYFVEEHEHEFSTEWKDKVLTVLVTDMSGFTRLTRKRGVIHFGSLIAKKREIAFPILRRLGAITIVTEADDIIAAFPSAKSGLEAAIQISRALAAINNPLTGEFEDWQVKLGGMGLASGVGVLLTAHGHPTGEVFDSAFELGENVAENGALLVSHSFKQALDVEAGMPDGTNFGKFVEAPARKDVDRHYQFQPNDNFGIPPSAEELAFDITDLMPSSLNILTRRWKARGDEIAKVDAKINAHYNVPVTCVVAGWRYELVNATHGAEVALEVKEEVNELQNHAAKNHGGTFHGLFSLYPNQESAVRAALDLRAAFRNYASGKPSTRVPVLKGFGIGTGEAIIIPETDVVWGDCLNTAFKLGEDCATDEKIAVTPQYYTAVHQSTVDLCFAELHVEISGLTIHCYDVSLLN